VGKSRSSSCHRSLLSTGCLEAVLQPFFFHFRVHFPLKESNTYFESENILSRHGSLKVSKALIKAVNSIRLLVVQRKPALSSLRCFP
jgi:hypothetical protein